MEFFYSLEFSIPVSQITWLLLMITTAQLFGKIKLALLISYSFTLYWGYFLNREIIVNSVNQGEYIILIYFGFGISVVVLAMIGFIFQHESLSILPDAVSQIICLSQSSLNYPRSSIPRSVNFTLLR